MTGRITHYAALLTVCGAVLFAAEVSTDFDHKADFSRYHTYSWMGVRAGDSLWQDRITAAVDSALAAKGWSKVAAGGDASVSAVGRVTEQDTLETFYTGYPGWGWRGWGGMGMGMTTTTVEPQKVGNLTVDIFDGNTKQLVFRGTASEAISGKPDKNNRKMDEAVDKMFKKFPPQGKQ